MAAMTSMSDSSHIDEPNPGPPRASARSRLMKFVAAVVAIGVLVFAATAISNGGSSSSTTASAVPIAQSQYGSGPAMPAGGQRAFGTPVSGATLDKLTSVVTAKYPGTVERAMKRSDGSYVVHVFRSGGQEVHVLVSKDFKVTGVQQGGPPGAAPPAGQTAPGAGASAAQS